MVSTRILLIPITALVLGITVYIFGFTAPAYADCAGDLEQINTAMESATLSDADRAAIESSKSAAQEKLDAGDEGGCQSDLATVKMILQIE